MAVTIDANVLHVANEKASQASPECVLACVGELRRVRNGEMVCLDLSGFILDEYFRQRFGLSGQPGAGDAFFAWLFNNQGNPEIVEMVDVHPLDETGEQFAEFPDDADLAGFDRADRKYAAVALASDLRPKVLNAVDSDWWNFREALSKHGVDVAFLCPEQFDA